MIKDIILAALLIAYHFIAYYVITAVTKDKCLALLSVFTGDVINIILRLSEMR